MTDQNIIVTDREADESIKSLSTGSVVPAYEFFESDHIGQINDNIVSRKSTSNPVDNTLIKLLRAIVENPMRLSSDYPKLAKTSPNTFQKVRPILIDKRLIREYKLQTVGRGRCTIRLGPTEQGKKFLRDYDNNPRSD